MPSQDKSFRIRALKIALKMGMISWCLKTLERGWGYVGGSGLRLQIRVFWLNSVTYTFAFTKEERERGCKRIFLAWSLMSCLLSVEASFCVASFWEFEPSLSKIKFLEYTQAKQKSRANARGTSKMHAKMMWNFDKNCKVNKLRNYSNNINWLPK